MKRGACNIRGQWKMNQARGDMFQLDLFWDVQIPLDRTSPLFLLVRFYVYWYQPRRIHQVIQRQHYPSLLLQWVPRKFVWVDTNALSIVPGLVWVVHDYCEFCGRISAGIFVNHKNINIFSICHSSYYRGWSSFPPLRLSRDILNSPNRIRFDLSGWDLSG